MTILATLSAPRWHTVAEIAAATGLLPIVVRARLGAYTVARMVEWRGDLVTLKGGWLVRDRGGRVDQALCLDDAIGLARVLGGVVEREAT